MDGFNFLFFFLMISYTLEVVCTFFFCLRVCCTVVLIWPVAISVMLIVLFLNVDLVFSMQSLLVFSFAWWIRPRRLDTSA